MLDINSKAVERAMPLIQEFADNDHPFGKTKFISYVADFFGMSKTDAGSLVDGMISLGKLEVREKKNKARFLKPSQFILRPASMHKFSVASLLVAYRNYCHAVETGDYEGDFPIDEPELLTRKDAQGNEVAEVWRYIPGTSKRFQVSNFGHVRQIARRTRNPSMREMIFGEKPRNMIVSIDTKTFGWYLIFDSQRKFYPRDELMQLFHGIPVILDPAEDKEAMIRYHEHLMHLAEIERKEREAAEAASEMDASASSEKESE